MISIKVVLPRHRHPASMVTRFPKGAEPHKAVVVPVQPTAFKPVVVEKDKCDDCKNCDCEERGGKKTG